MKTEIEKLFWDIDKKSLKEKILLLGGKLVKAETLYKRVVWSLPLKEGRHNWLRLRDEGNKIVLTYKIKSEGEHAEEVETIVTNFEETKQILECLIGEPNSYQENYREVFVLENFEIVIDTWPFLEPVCEIESESEDEIMKLAERLGLNTQNSMRGNVTSVYHLKYGKWIPELPLAKQKQITFQDENPFL